MQLTGLPIETIAWLAGAAAIFITVFYILKLRKRSVEIPFSPMWNRVLTSSRHRTDWWRRFKRILSWLLHIVLAALLAAAALGPHFDDEILDERHLLILLDNSASMGATDVTGGYDRFDVARRKTSELLETIGGNDRVMVVLFNNRVQPLGPFIEDSSLLEASMRDLSATSNPTDLRQALTFAADSLRDRNNSELVIISDGAGLDPDTPIDVDFGPETTVRHIKIGESSENLAITAFNARRYPSNRLDHELYVEVTSYFDRPVEAVLEISSDGRLVDTQRLSLDARETHRQFYPGQAVTGERLEARVRLQTSDARDVFPLDDRAFATVPPPKRLRAQLVSTGNLFIEGPLILNPHIDFQRIAPEDYDPAADFDITVFDRIAPQPPATGDLLYLDPPEEGSPFTISGREAQPIITDVVQSHPLLRWITLQDLNIGSSKTFTRSANDTAVASSFGQPIILAREDDDRRMVAIGFDLRNSDFPLRVSFPVFVLNILDYFAQDDVDLMYSFATGQTWSIPVDRAVTTAHMVTPDGERRATAIHDGAALFFGDKPGFYRLETDLGAITLAANLSSPEESDITPGSLELESTAVSEEMETLFFERQQLWILLLFAALALLLVEWLTFNRRWTV